MESMLPVRLWQARSSVASVMHVNADPDAGTREHPGIGGATGQKIETCASVIDLFNAVKADLKLRVPRGRARRLPVVSNWRGVATARGQVLTIQPCGLVSKEFSTAGEILTCRPGRGTTFCAPTTIRTFTGSPTSEGALIWVHPEVRCRPRRSGSATTSRPIPTSSVSNRSRTHHHPAPEEGLRRSGARPAAST